jgi:hypothetical protein
MARASKPPSRFRLLTPAENKRLGYSPGAKRRVSAGLKRVSKHTRVYTDREVAQIKLGVTKEQATRERVKVVTRRGGGTVVTVSNVRKQALIKQLQKLDPDAIVVLVIKADRLGYRQNEPWTSGTRVRAKTLLDPDAFAGYLEENEIVGKPSMYGLTIL